MRFAEVKIGDEFFAGHQPFPSMLRRFVKDSDQSAKLLPIPPGRCDEWYPRSETPSPDESIGFRAERTVFPAPEFIPS